MSTYAQQYPTADSWPAMRALRLVRLALFIGIASGIPFAAILLTSRLTPDGQHFRHTADYWITGLGIPYLAAPILLLIALRSLHCWRDGRLGRIGALVTGVSLATIVALLPRTLVVSTTSGVGPVYPIAAFMADIGMVLFCLGAFRARLMPRTLAVAWLVAWVAGGALAPVWGPPLLIATYVVMAATLPKRMAAAGNI
jgi:hypothetical protein